MFGLWGKGIKASSSFYRNIFAIMAFVFFGIALLTNSPSCFLAVLLFGGLSRTSVKKGWKNPEFAEKNKILVRRDENDKN